MSRLDEQFESAKVRGGDINEHLDNIVELCKGSDTIVEMGVRTLVSTWAFLKAFPKKLISIDIATPESYAAQGFSNPGLKLTEEIAKENGIDFEFILQSSLEVVIPEVDILFIDTLHVYSQLIQELKYHHGKVKKYIIMHDTTACPELNTAINEFLEENKNWSVFSVWTNNNGLTVLKNEN